MWVTRSLSLFYHSVNCILRRLPRVQEITFHCFYSQGLMILKVPPSDLHKNANLAELRCNKKNFFVPVFSLHWVFWSVSLSPQLCFTCMLLSHEKKPCMFSLQYVDFYAVLHEIIFTRRKILRLILNLVSLNKILISFFLSVMYFRSVVFIVSVLWLFLHQNESIYRFLWQQNWFSIGSNIQSPILNHLYLSPV